MVVPSVKLRAQQSQWDELGRTDPLWAILTDPERKYGRWDVEEFFARGQAEIDLAMREAERLGVPAQREAALDFGCGVGRLTQAMAGYFAQVTGVDIAPAMLELAEKYNHHGARCRYVLNEHDHLRQFPSGSFDFVHSWITLQHLPRRHIRRYLREMVRILRPGGLLLFQLPGRHHYSSLKHFLLHNIYSTVARKVLRVPSAMDMYAIDPRAVVRLLEESGARILESREVSAPGDEWESYRYAATK